MTDQDAKAVGVLEMHAASLKMYWQGPLGEASTRQDNMLVEALTTALGWAKEVEELRAALEAMDEAGMIPAADSFPRTSQTAVGRATQLARAALAQPEAGEGEKP